MPIHIQAIDDPRIEDYVGLRDRKESDEFLIAETPIVVERLVASSLRIRSFLFTQKTFDKMWFKLGNIDAPFYIAEPEVLQGITGYEVHRGVLASADRPTMPGLLDVMVKSKRLVILEGSNDHENIGAIARSARALGFDGMVLDPTCADPYYRRCIRVSMGEILHLPIVRSSLWPEALGMLSRAGFETWALTPGGAAQSLFSMPWPEKLALVAGSEGDGLSGAALAACQARVRIPMHHGVDSLNLSHSLAIAMAATSPPVT
ncbi:MAG: RNA methyltransferase [Actinomycetota bacterium]